jgi:hypothetical protein
MRRQLHPGRAALICFAIALALLYLMVTDACPGTLGDAAVVAAAGADIASTHIAMQRGGQEINTVSSIRGQAAFHAAVAGGAILLAHEAEKGGHKGWAKVVRAIPIVFFGGAAAWNLTKGGRR